MSKEGAKGRRVADGFVDAEERAVEAEAEPVPLRHVKVALERGKGRVDHRGQEDARVLLVNLRDAAAQLDGALFEDGVAARLSLALRWVGVGV